MKTGPIILFDGICNLCNSAVQFIIKRDKHNTFKFASLQSASGKAICSRYNIPASLNTMILIENDVYYTKSTAALRITKHLKFGWPLLYGLLIFPAFMRDGVYDFIAKRRYKWFGKSDACMIPTPALQARFLE